jgi:hypothetical protein
VAERSGDTAFGDVNPEDVEKSIIRIDPNDAQQKVDVHGIVVPAE